MSQVGSTEGIGAQGSKGAFAHLLQSSRLPVSFLAASSHFSTPELRFQAAKFTVGQNTVNTPHHRSRPRACDVQSGAARSSWLQRPLLR